MHHCNIVRQGGENIPTIFEGTIEGNIVHTPGRHCAYCYDKSYSVARKVWVCHGVPHLALMLGNRSTPRHSYMSQEQLSIWRYVYLREKYL